MVLLTPQQARAGAQLASQQATAAREEAPRSALGWHGDVEAEPEAELFEIINPDTVSAHETLTHVPRIRRQV